MNHQSDHGYDTGAVSHRCVACGSMRVDDCVHACCEDRQRETPFMRFWRELNAALAARGIAEARYREAKDFHDSGYADAAEVARTWSA